jgi:hypothetical protein
MMLRATMLAGVLACALAGCRSLRTDEGLAMLTVTAAADTPAFTSVRFSVAGRSEIAPHEVIYDGKSSLQFGYYLPGPSGVVRVTGQAWSASCVVGVGTAQVNVQLGQVSPPVAMVIMPVASVDPSCAAPLDASADGPIDAAADASSDGLPDARADGPTARPDSGPPACLVATKACAGGGAACCSGLVCGTTSLGQVCCGNFESPCMRPGGEDCCGQLECINGGCCLPATYACTGTSCCAGLTCGTTSLGRTCCGAAGAPCIRPDGADCCGALRCVNNVCSK